MGEVAYLKRYPREGPGLQLGGKPGTDKLQQHLS